MRKIGQYLLARDRNAAIAGFLFALFPVLNLPGGGFFASIVVAFVTLCRGYKSGLIVLAWVALPTISMLVLRRLGIFDLLLLQCLIVWVLALVFRHLSSSWSVLLEIGVFLSIIAILGVHIFVPNVKSLWTQYVMTYVNELSNNPSWELTTADKKILTDVLINRFVPMSTGLAAFIILTAIFVSLFLARWWQSIMGDKNKFKPEFISIHIGRGVALISLLFFLGLVFKVPVIIDMLPVLLIPFMIAGLSVLHYFYEKNKNLLFVLIPVYMGLFFLPLIIVFLLVIVGYMDSWYDVRKKLANSRS
jgi:hypothetical protein